METPKEQTLLNKFVILALSSIAFLLIIANKSGLFSDNPIPLIRYLVSEEFIMYPMGLSMIIAIFYISYEKKEPKDLVGKNAFKNYFSKTKIIKIILIFILYIAILSWLQNNIDTFKIILLAIPVPLIMIYSFFAAIKPQIPANSQPIVTTQQPIKKKKVSVLLTFILIIIYVFLELLDTPLLGVVTGNPKDIPPIQFKDSINDFKNPPDGGYPPDGVRPYASADLKAISLSNTDVGLTIKYEMNDELIRGSFKEVDGNDPIVYQEIVMAIKKDGDALTDLYNNPDALLLFSTFIDIYTYPDEKKGYRDYSNEYYLPNMTGPGIPRQYKSKKFTDGFKPNFSPFPPLNNVSIYYSLSELGLKKGDKISFHVWSNIETTKWKHYSFDVFPEKGNKEFTLK